MKKAFVKILLIFASFSAFAMDLEFGLQWDNFDESTKGNVGVSFNFTENLTQHFEIYARSDNLYNHRHDTSFGINFETDIFNLSSGILFVVRNNKIAPGFSLDSQLKFGRVFGLGLDSEFAFMPSNLYDNSLINLEGKALFFTKNADVTLSYDYEHLFVTSGINFTHTGKFEVLAFEEGFPFKIDVFFDSFVEKHSYETNYLNLEIEVGTKLIFDFKKYGKYVLEGECQILNLQKQNAAIYPVAISFSTMFPIE